MTRHRNYGTHTVESYLAIRKDGNCAICWYMDGSGEYQTELKGEGQREQSYPYVEYK